MKQTRLTSLLKSSVSTAAGFGVALAANALVLPWFGYSPTLSENLLLTTIYTVISIARGYALERLFEAMGWRLKISPFMAAVMAERQRQIEVEGWSHDHDDTHLMGELARAGASYARHSTDHLDHRVRLIPPAGWPWDAEWWKPVGFRRDLVKAGALVIAEGEKFDRARKSKRKDPALTADAITPRSALVNHSLQSLAHGKTRSEQGGAPV